MFIKTKFVIKDIEIASGIKSHTIRMWEKRYKLLKPKRGPRNIRYYSIEEFKKILNIAILYNQGLRISKIARLSNEQIKQKVIEISKEAISVETEFTVLTLKIISSVIETNIDEIDRILNTAIEKYGFKVVFRNLLIPALEKIGLLWQSNSISSGQEHIFTNLIRDKIIKLETEKTSIKNPLTFLLFLPDQELHEIGLLFARFLIKSYGHKVIYLGQATPIHDVISLVQKISKIDYILTSLVKPIEKKDLKEMLRKLTSTKKSIIIIGRQLGALNLKKYSNLKIFVDISEFDRFLSKIQN